MTTTTAQSHQRLEINSERMRECVREKTTLLQGINSKGRVKEEDHHDDEQPYHLDFSPGVINGRVPLFCLGRSQQLIA